MARDQFVRLKTDLALEGLDNLIKQLADLDSKITDKALREVVSKGSTILLRAMRSRLTEGHGVESGLLRNSLGRKTLYFRAGRTAFGVVGPRRDFKVTRRVSQRLTRMRRSVKYDIVPTKYAHLVEFGTSPHFQPRRGVRHPGARPKPFMRPALDESRPAIEQLFADVLRRAVDTVRARGLRRGGG